MTLPNLRRLRLREYVPDPSPKQKRVRTAFLSRSIYLETVELDFIYLRGDPLMTFSFEGLTVRNLRSFTICYSGGGPSDIPNYHTLANSFRAFTRRHPKLETLSLNGPFVANGFVFSLDDMKHIRALQLPALTLAVEAVPEPLQLQVLSIVIVWGWPVEYPVDMHTRLRPLSMHLRCLHISFPFVPVGRDLPVVPFLREIVLCLQVVEEIGVSVRSTMADLNATVLVRVSNFHRSPALF